MKAAKCVVMIPVCPKCDTGLFIVKFKSIEVDYCERCRGVWLDAGELEQLAGGPLLGFQQLSGPAGKHLCPRCDQRLCELTVDSDLTLDRCPRGHGLWFDANELQQLLSKFGRSIEHLNDIFGKSNHGGN